MTYKITWLNMNEYIYIYIFFNKILHLYVIYEIVLYYGVHNF
jgi:hypothetical protein